VKGDWINRWWSYCKQKTSSFPLTNNYDIIIYYLNELISSRLHYEILVKTIIIFRLILLTYNHINCIQAAVLCFYYKLISFSLFSWPALSRCCCCCWRVAAPALVAKLELRLSKTSDNNNSKNNNHNDSWLMRELCKKIERREAGTTLRMRNTATQQEAAENRLISLVDGDDDGGG